MFDTTNSPLKEKPIKIINREKRFPTKLFI